MFSYDILFLLGVTLILVVFAASVNSLVFSLCKKFQQNGFCWLVTHGGWEKNLTGFVLAAGIGWLVVASWVEARRNDPVVLVKAADASAQYVEFDPLFTNTIVAIEEDEEDENLTIDEMFERDKQEARLWAAYAIWYEARGETPKGRLAVASVLWNRSQGNPGNFLTVLQSTNWLGTPEILDPRRADTTCSVYREAYLLADDMVFGRFRPAGTWTHFYNPSKVSPTWKRQLVEKRVIGGHVFGVIP